MKFQASKNNLNWQTKKIKTIENKNLPVHANITSPKADKNFNKIIKNTIRKHRYIGYS